MVIVITMISIQYFCVFREITIIVRNGNSNTLLCLLNLYFKNPIAVYPLIQIKIFS